MPRIRSLAVALLDVAADIEAAEEQRDPDGEGIAYEVHAEEPVRATQHAAGDAIGGHPGGSTPHREQDYESGDGRLPQSRKVERLPDQRNASNGEPPRDGDGEQVLVDRIGKNSGLRADRRRPGGW